MSEFAHEVSEILEILKKSNQTLAVAESLTGGLLAGALTSVAGSSDVFVGGVVAYHARIKSQLLGVPEELITQCGVVSREVALEMAIGAQGRLGSDWAIATTGVAGPGASNGINPGQVWIAIAGPARSSLPPEGSAQLLNLPGNRQEVRLATIARALEAFTRILRG